jgi:hypothetical protein
MVARHKDPSRPGIGGNGFGGGLYVASGQVTLTGVTLDNNSATGGHGGTDPNGNVIDSAGNEFGVALTTAGGTTTVSSDTLASNTAQGGGSGTSAVGGNGYGGAIDAAGGTVSLCGDSVESNSSTGGTGTANGHGYAGGIYIVSGASVYLDSFTVANTINNADSSGLNGSTANIDGSYILQNC